MDMESKLDQQDNSRRQRTPGDFPRTGDGSPYFHDGESVKRDGDPKLKRAGRMSSAGGAVKGGGGFGIQRHNEVYDFAAVAVQMDEAARLIGPYPALWDLTSKSVRATMNTLLVEGRNRVGKFIKADRGTLIHEVSDRVATAMIAGDSPMAVDLEDLYEEATELGMSSEVVEKARDLYIRFYNEVATPVASEVRAINVEHNLAGTADHMIRLLGDIDFGGITLTAGTLVGGDTKTGRVDSMTEVSQAAQLAGYFGRHAMRYVFDGPEDEVGHPEAWPDDLCRDYAIVVSVKLDDALSTGNLTLRLILVDLAVGEQILNLASTVNRFDAGNVLHEASGVSLTVGLQSSELVTGLQASLDAVAHERVQEWLHQRLAVIAEYPRALEKLQEMWPDDVARDAIKTRTLSPEHVNGIGRLLGHIESSFSLPFGATDPRSALTGSSKKGLAS